MSFRKSNPPVGSRPGTLAIPSGSPPPKVWLHAYSQAGFRSEPVEDLATLPARIDEREVTWVDVQGLGDEAVLLQIGEIFGLHPLVLENAVNVPQRAKSEVFESHHLIVARVPVAEEDGTLGTPPQVCIALSARVLITFQERYFGFFDAVRERIRLGLGPIRELGADYLAFALLDTMVDHYFPLTEALSESLEELEEEVNHDPHPDLLGRIHTLRRQLVVIRRVGWPQREAINRLLRDSSPFITEQVRTYLRATSDHITQIMELTDATREAAVGLTEIYLSQVSFRTNEIMKVLTLMASIFIPLTFIAGIYGMNFENMPELTEPVGYFAVLSVMVGVAVVMIAYFYRRGWIGQRGRRRKSGRQKPG